MEKRIFSKITVILILAVLISVFFIFGKVSLGNLTGNVVAGNSLPVEVNIYSENFYKLPLIKIDFESSNFSRNGPDSQLESSYALFGSARIIEDPERGNILVSDSNNSYLSVSESNNLGLSEDLSLSLWFKIEDWPDNYSGLTEKYSSDKLSEWFVGFEGRNLTFQNGAVLFDNSLDVDAKNSGIDLGRWINLVLVKDSTEGKMKIYVDGKIVADKQIGGFSSSTDSEVIVGKSSVRTLYDNFRIYDYSLNDSEILSLFSQESKRKIDKISVKNVLGSEGFYYENGSRFFVNGFKTNFDLNNLDLVQTNSFFHSLNNKGYNTIYYKISSPSISGEDENNQRLNEDYVSGLINMVKLARANNIHVILSFDGLPISYNSLSEPWKESENISRDNELILHKGTVNAFRIFVSDVLYKINNEDDNLLNDILAVSFEPEFNFNEKPFSEDAFTFNGKNYDLKDYGRASLIKDSSSFWIGEVISNLRESYSEIAFGVELSKEGNVFDIKDIYNLQDFDFYYLDLDISKGFVESVKEFNLQGFLIDKPIIGGTPLYRYASMKNSCGEGFDGWIYSSTYSDSADFEPFSC